MGFSISYALKHEVDDLEEAWGFVKKDPNESDDEENEVGQGAELESKELTADELGKANTALQAHMLIVAEIKKKIDQELFMAEAAATGGWAAVSVLENKSFAKITGASDAEKELKMQRIRKAIETARKEESSRSSARSSTPMGSKTTAASAARSSTAPTGGKKEAAELDLPVTTRLHPTTGTRGVATVATVATMGGGLEARREAWPGLKEPATGAKALATWWLPARCPRRRRNSEGRPREQEHLGHV